MTHFCILFSFFLVLLFLKVYINSVKDLFLRHRRDSIPFSRLRMQKYTKTLEQPNLYSTFFEKSFDLEVFREEIMGFLEEWMSFTKSLKYWLCIHLIRYIEFLKLLKPFIATFLENSYYNKQGKHWFPYCVWKCNKDVGSRAYCISWRAYCDGAIW